MNLHTRRFLANAVVTGLAVICAVDLWSIVANLHRASLVSRFASHPASISLLAAHHADQQVSISGLVYVLVLVVVGVLFLVWLHEVVTDLHRLRPGTPRYSPAWAVGGWFVPILNLIRPKQVVDDAWRASAPTGRAGSQPPAFLSYWWTGWILQAVVFSVGYSINNGSMTSLADHDRVYAVGRGLDIVVAAMAILIVRTLTARVNQVSASAARPESRLTSQFQVPPNWPTPPAGWTPPLGWMPDPQWPPAPANWQFWRPTPAWHPEPAWQAASLNWEYWAT